MKLGLTAGIMVCATVFACTKPWKPAEPVGHRRTEVSSSAGEQIGSHACYDCHDSFEQHFIASDYHSDCESCHGPGQLHAHTALARDIAYPSNGACGDCHQVGSRTLLRWTSSLHARSDVLCTDCHDTHNREPLHLRLAGALESAKLPRAGDGSRLCATCHPEVVAQLDLPSHHPVAEGMLACADCHDPHGGRAVGPQTAQCASCHQEVMGPWIHEHLPVTEDCGLCHVPHGSSADFLLLASEPAACISCHTIATAGAVHDPFAFTTRCSDCHNAVHGSMTDPHLRR